MDGADRLASSALRDDCVASVGGSLEWFESIAGRQPNDPDWVASTVIEAVALPEPPLRLALGEEAVQAVREKLDAHRRDLDTCGELSITTAVGS